MKKVNQSINKIFYQELLIQNLTAKKLGKILLKYSRNG